MTFLLNTTKKLLSVVMLFGIALSIFSCGDDLKNTKYTPDNNSVSFPSQSATYAIEIQENVFDVKIVRGIADQALTLPVTIQDQNNLFTLASSSVTFDAGVYEVNIPVKYTSTNLTFGKSYSFALSFDKTNMAITGESSMTVNAMLKLDYEDYGTISCAAGNFFGLLSAENRNFKLFLAKNTKNCYKIVNLYNGKQDVEFVINGGLVTFISPGYAYYNADDVAGYPMHQIVTGMNHSSYGILTAWLDSNPAKVVCSNLGAGDQLILNSQISLNTWYTVKAGFFGWYKDVLKITAIK